jgi:Alw26I/Eco31I/Esp3I family type II restriction endonuclease
MSNAPDRFDGFHSFNLCCRGTADTGRHRDNLASYATDRRVFEYWADGDWIAANTLMGEIRARFGGQSCRNLHSGPCDADHIGPISLGFAHRPEFQLLCKPCNSAKNNRMSLADVQHLLSIEREGISVISWHSKALWDLCKPTVLTDETALRLSKLLRDNRHSFMAILRQVERRGFYAFLLSLLNLECADFYVEFHDLKIVNSTTFFSVERRAPRTTKYAVEQKARRCRIALETLRDYFKKESRNARVIATTASTRAVDSAVATLATQPAPFKKLDKQIARALKGAKQDRDTRFRMLVRKLPREWPPEFDTAKRSLSVAMERIAKELSSQWNDERYVRAEASFD